MELKEFEQRCKETIREKGSFTEDDLEVIGIKYVVVPAMESPRSQTPDANVIFKLGESLYITDVCLDVFKGPLSESLILFEDEDDIGLSPTSSEAIIECLRNEIEELCSGISRL